MGEKKYKYTTRIGQPQNVCGIKLVPKEGVISERELKALKKDKYGASLIEKGILVIDESNPITKQEKEETDANDEAGKETIPEINTVDNKE